MCINLGSNYGCGHKYRSKFPCDNGRCKKTEEVNTTKHHQCHDCTIRGLLRERDEAKQMAQDAKSTPRKMFLTQEAHHEKGSKVVLADCCIHIYLTTTFACGHEVETIWECDAAKDTKDVHRDYIQQDALLTSDQNCIECQVQG
jgi:hypothetical protein